MTDDERFERDLAAVVQEGAPTTTPSSLLQRVETSMAAEDSPWPRRVVGPLLGATAAVVVLFAAAIVGPKLVHAPGQTPGSTSIVTAQGSPSASQPISTAAPPTAPARKEPILHPGFLEDGELLTATDAWATSFDNRLLITHSAGAAWRDITPEGVNPDLPWGPFFTDALHGWVTEIGDSEHPDLRIWRTPDAGSSWTQSVLPRVGGGNGSAVFLTPTVGWLATDPGGDHPKPELRWTSDAGATWSDPIDLAAAAGITVLEPIVFVDRQVGFLSGEELFRRTTDGGETWTDVDFAPRTMQLGSDPKTFRFGVPTFVDDMQGLVEVGVHAKDGSLVASAVFVTHDGGATWDLALRDDLHRSWMFIDERTWVAFDGQHVWTTSDGGQSIAVAPSSGLPDPLGSAHGRFVDPLRGWVTAAKACPRGYYCSIIIPQLFATTDGGRTWTPVGDCPSRGGQFLPCSSRGPG